MKLFLKLISLASLLALMLIKSLWLGKTINMTSDDIAINSTNFSVDKNGNMICTNAKISAKGGSNTGSSSGLNLKVVSDSTYNYAGLAPGFGIVRGGQYNYINMTADGTNVGQEISGNLNNYISSNVRPSLNMVTSLWYSNGTSTQVSATGIRTPTLTQTSKESLKKNIKKYDANATNIVKSSQLYTYNFKSEDDKDKKHIGFVIGDEGGDYSTPEEVISADKEGINGYDMTSILWKAVQEQQETIENLQKEIELLKGGKINE